MSNCINGFVGVSNRKAEQPARTQTANGANKKLVLHVQLRCGSLSITAPVSSLANKLMFESTHVNQFCVIHEAMNSCKYLKIHSRLASKM